MVDNSLLELGKLVDFFYHMDYIDDLGETHNQLDGFMNLWLHGLLTILMERVFIYFHYIDVNNMEYLACCLTLTKTE